MSDHKVILVTGASRGLGFSVAEELAEPGSHVLALARTVGGLEELDDRIKAKQSRATLVPLDITDEGGLQRLGAAIHERWGRLDTWVHTAAHAVPLAPVEHIAEKDMDKAWAVNARATQRLIAMLDPLLKAAPASRAAIMTHDPQETKFFGAYRASKLAQRALCEAWAQEVRQLGVRVHLHEPAAMGTALRARFFPGENRDALSSPRQEAKRVAELLKG